MLARQRVACLSFAHVGARNSITVSAACPNVGMLAFLIRGASMCTAGSTPSCTSWRMSSAWSRAAFNETSGYPPTPSCRRRPSTVRRRTQFFPPDGWTRSMRPPPSMWVPGCACFTCRGESLFRLTFAIVGPPVCVPLFCVPLAGIVWHKSAQVKTGGRSPQICKRPFSGGSTGCLVPREGIEPPIPCGKRILSPPRLPFRHLGSISCLPSLPSRSTSCPCRDYGGPPQCREGCPGAWRTRCDCPSRRD